MEIRFGYIIKIAGHYGEMEQLNKLYPLGVTRSASLFIVNLKNRLVIEAKNADAGSCLSVAVKKKIYISILGLFK